MYGTNKKMGSILPGRLHKLNNTLNNIQEYTKQYISILYKYTLYEYIVYVNVIMYSAGVLQIMKIFLIFYFSSRVVSIFPHPHPLPSILPPFGFVHGSFIHVFDSPSSSFPPYPSPLTSLVNFSLFFISKSLIIYCLLVCFIDQVLLIGEIIWYLFFTARLISLSVMLSSSIHALVKGRSSFFLSAAQYSIV